MDATRLRGTCFHEAGHAVLAVALGLDVVRVSVVPDERSYGRLEHRGVTTDQLDPAGEFGDKPAALLALAEQLAILRLDAGGAAQRLAGFDPRGSGSDDLSAESAAERAACFLGDYTASWRGRLRREVERFLEAHWSAVERIAEALNVERELDGHRVRELAGEVSRPDTAALRYALFLANKRPARRTTPPEKGGMSMQKFLAVGSFRMSERHGDVYEGQIVEATAEEAFDGLRLNRLRPVSPDEAEAILREQRERAARTTTPS